MSNQDDQIKTDSPASPRAVARMLAPLLLVFGFFLLWFGKTEGGFLILVMSVFALVSGLFFHRDREGDD